MSADPTVTACWRICGRCEGYMCRECIAGEIPMCPSCSESPDAYFMSSADADAWVDDVIAHGGECQDCRVATIGAADTDPAPDFGSEVELAADPFLNHEAAPSGLFTDEHEEAAQ